MADYMNFNQTLYEVTIDNLKVQVEQLNRGTFHGPCVRHRHGKIYYEAHLVKSGAGTLVTDDREFPLKPGALYMTGPEVAHAQLTDADAPMTEYCLAMNVRPIAGAKPTPLSEAFLNTHFFFGEDVGGVCLGLFEQIESESTCRRVGWVSIIEGCILAIIVALVRRYTDNAESAPSAPAPNLTLDHRRMNLIDLCFLKDYATITEPQLAQTLCLSSRQVQRFLKEHYGKTFSQMKQEARLNKARALLQDGATMTAAAAAVGYDDAESLSKLLRKK